MHHFASLINSHSLTQTPKSLPPSLLLPPSLPPLPQVPSLHSLDERRPRPGHGQRLKTSDRLQEYIERRGTAKLYQELENYVNQRLSLSLSLGRNGADELMAIAHQQKEMQQFNKTLKKVLCVDTSATCIAKPHVRLGKL